MPNRSSPFTWIDWSLSAAIACNSLVLLALLLQPAAAAWINRPRPGVQVSQQYLMPDSKAYRAGAIDYLLYLPPDYDTAKKWPLVVFLHGAGERGQDLELVRRVGLPQVLERDKQRPWGFVLLSPQCPAGSGWSSAEIVALIEDVSGRLAVDRDRVYLTGYSMGGYGTWATASREPERFAAIAPLCGGGDAAQAERLKNLPIWAFHGDKDTAVPLKQGQAMVDAVRKCGGKVEFTVYRGAGHGIWDITYQDERFIEWLLAQRRKRDPS